MAPSRPTLNSDIRASTTATTTTASGMSSMANPSKTRRIASSNVTGSSGLKGTPMLHSVSSGVTSALAGSSSGLGGGVGAGAAGGAMNNPIEGRGGSDGNGNGHAVSGGSMISWPSLPTTTLHKYAHAHRLTHTSSAFHGALNGMVLTNPGIGKHAPIMNVQRERRRQTKEALATAVRKSFNAAAVVEGEVVVEFVYVVRANKAGRGFRHRFGSGRDARR